MGAVLNLTELERQVLVLVLGEHIRMEIKDSSPIKLGSDITYKLVHKLDKLSPKPSPLLDGEKTE